MSRRWGCFSCLTPSPLRGGGSTALIITASGHYHSDLTCDGGQRVVRSAFVVPGVEIRVNSPDFE